MDTLAISVSQVLSRWGRAGAPLLIDTRAAGIFDSDGRMIACALRRDPGRIPEWSGVLPRDRKIIVYCGDGQRSSVDAAAALRANGLDAGFLEGGIEAWRHGGGTTMRKNAECGVPAPAGNSSRWITREHPKIDRIACPWLIRRFIDPLAKFEYVAANQVRDAAERLAAIPYDVPGVTFSHRGEKCSFDAFIEDFDLHDSALERLATMVRGADTACLDLAPQCAGLLSASLGLSACYPDDHEMLEQGMVLYDALYAWCRSEDTNANKSRNRNNPS